MLIASKVNRKRSAATAVEMAVVVLILIMLVFGIFEYCMIVFTQNIVENAAREGTRYAVVNTSGATVVSDTQTYVLTLMDGLNLKDAPYTCDVYLADANGNNIGAASGAKFGQYICVDVSVTYTPMTPGLLYLKTFTIRSKCSMISEAN